MPGVSLPFGQAGLAHLVERHTCNVQVVGSSPTPGSSGVERLVDEASDREVR